MGPKRREVGSRRDSAGVSAAVIVRGPSRPPSLARARGVRRELAGCGQGSGTRRVLDRREGRGGRSRIESPLPHGPSDWRARLRFSQETPVRSGGGGGPDSDPRRGGGPWRKSAIWTGRSSSCGAASLSKRAKSRPCVLRPGEPGGPQEGGQPVAEGSPLGKLS